ncbi:hypothetical protein GW17_00026689 [Ensete ventricosum]|nr:hypothetical protein GW17_00026689 [Ensete ventricosum]
MRSSVYSLQHLPVSFGAKSESHGPLAHDASKFMQAKSPMEASAGGFQISSLVAHAPVLSSAASSFKQPHISDVQAVVNPVKQSSGPLERGSSSALVKLNARPGGPSYLTQSQECLLICDACEKANHLKCLQSYGNKSIPKAEWHCPRCLASSNGKPLPPKYGRVTRAPVSAPKTAANASVHASSKETESLDTRVNEQKSIASGNSGVAQQAYSLNMEDNHCMSIPDSRTTGGEVQVIMTIIGSKREDETLKAIDADPLKEITGAVCTHPDMHSEDLNNIEDNRLSLVDAKPTSESVLEPIPMPKGSCEHSHDMVVENNNLSEAPLTHDFDHVKLSGNINASAIQLDENVNPVKSEPEAALGEKRSPEYLDGCSDRLAKEGSCQTSDGDGYYNE